jgi:hypothetical protein
MIFAYLILPLALVVGSSFLGYLGLRHGDQVEDASVAVSLRWENQAGSWVVFAGIRVQNPAEEVLSVRVRFESTRWWILPLREPVSVRVPWRQPVEATTDSPMKVAIHSNAAFQLRVGSVGDARALNVTVSLSHARGRVRVLNFPVAIPAPVAVGPHPTVTCG